MTYQITKEDALIVVDVLNDFGPKGNLPVPHGDEIVMPINSFMNLFWNQGAKIVLIQDWHPANHGSFASQHRLEPFSTIQLPYGEQTLWTDHAVQGTWGAEFQPLLDTSKASLILRKGMNEKVDSYSAFYENDRETSTGLGGYLKASGVKRVFVVGLAYDYCVGYTACDAVLKEGLKTVVVRDLCRAISDQTEQNMTMNFMSIRIPVITAAEVA